MYNKYPQIKGKKGPTIYYKNGQNIGKDSPLQRKHKWVLNIWKDTQSYKNANERHNVIQIFTY